MPDVIAVRCKFKGPYPAAAPELCVEILSPKNMLAKALDKTNSYISWGSECVWVIDPEKRTSWTLAREGAPEPTWISPGGTVRIGETAIELRTLFAEVDKKMELSEEEG